MVEIKLPTFGLTDRIRLTIDSYHSKILEEGKRVGYSEAVSHEQHRKGIYTKDISKCIPWFLDDEYQPFKHIEDLSHTCSESIYYRLYPHLNFFWRECSNLDHVPLDDQLIIYNRAYAISLHALNTVQRPNEYIDCYKRFSIEEHYLLHHSIMGVVYNLLSHEQRTLYIDILLKDIIEILQEDFPEIIEVVTPQPPQGEYKQKRGRKPDNLFTDVHETQAKVKEFKEYCKDCLTIKVNTTESNPINIAIKKKLKEWFTSKYDPNARAVYRFLHDDCNLEFDLSGKSVEKQWGTFFRRFWHKK